MTFMLYGQHLVLPIVARQFEDPPIIRRLRGQDRKDSSKMPTRKRSSPEASTGSQTSIILEDDIVEHSSNPGNSNKGEHDNDLTHTLGWGIMVGGGEDDGVDSSSSHQEPC